MILCFSSVYDKRHIILHICPKDLCQDRDTLVGPNAVLLRGTAGSVIRDVHIGEKPRALTFGIVSVPGTMKQQIRVMSIKAV